MQNFDAGKGDFSHPTRKTEHRAALHASDQALHLSDWENLQLHPDSISQHAPLHSSGDCPASSTAAKPTLATAPAVQYMLQEHPCRKVTPEQMEAPDSWSLVLIAQDVWHVINRILAKVNRSHPNLPALKAELKAIFSVVSKKAPRLTAGSFEGLQTKIWQIAQQLSQQLNALRERFAVFEDRETTQQRALRDLREAFAADEVDEVLQDGFAVDQTAFHFSERQPTAITTRDTISTAVVRTPTLLFHGNKDMTYQLHLQGLHLNAVTSSHAQAKFDITRSVRRATITRHLVGADRKQCQSWQVMLLLRAYSGSLWRGGPRAAMWSS
jgi:hypothetical protein